MSQFNTVKHVLTLMDETAIDDETRNGDSIDVGKMRDFVALLVGVEEATATTLDVKLQHSHDGVLWLDWITFTTLTDTGNEVKYPALASLHPLAHVRAVAVGVGGMWGAKVILTANVQQ